MRLRITFSKQGALRYTGHLDVHKLWERAARRADLPLTYSQGFHPQPKIHLAAALPLGFSSRGEVMDMRLNETLDLEQVARRLRGALPEGIQILHMETVEEGGPALQTQVLSATYEIRLTESLEAFELTSSVERIMQADSLPRERRGKNYDLRPLIEMISVVREPSGHAWLRMTLSAREGATGRPEEVLDELGIASDSVHVERTSLIFS